MSKNKGVNLLLFILPIPLLTLSILSISTFGSAGAATDAVRWTKVNIPTQGDAGNWVLADGSDVQLLTQANDGTLYAYGKGLTFTLYRSTDNGISWRYIGNVQDAIIDIAVSPRDSDSIYYATTSDVYRSGDGGKTFLLILASPGGAGAGNIEITSIDVTWLQGDVIAVGTRDTDNAEYGGVYILEEADVLPALQDTGIDNYDVYNVTFSPNYSQDRQLAAVVTDEVDTFATNKIGDSGWGAGISHARLDRDNSGIPTSIIVADTAAIAFPDDYDADTSSTNSYYYVAVDTGTENGDVYEIRCMEFPYDSIATDLNIGFSYGQDNVDTSGLSARGGNGAVTLLAGAAGSSRTYLSTDRGRSWTRSRKEATGQSDTGVLISSHFGVDGLLYAATSGNGSALSMSRDGGKNWNQVSLIDATVSAILDVAPSPDFARDNTLYMITFGGDHGLWRSTDGGSTWERLLSSRLDAVDALAMVGLPPQYGANCRTVFATGTSSGNPTVWESEDNGESFRRRFTRDPATGNPVTIDAWAIAGETELFLGSYDGTRGLVYHTVNSGFTCSEAAAAGTTPLHSISLSPAWDRDSTILTGNTAGLIYRSVDGGASFQALPGDSVALPLNGNTAVAFDSAYESNHTVYAAGDAADAGIYRLTADTHDDWENIGENLAAGTIIDGISTSASGVLYAANSDADGGMLRCLDPTFALGPTLEAVTRGLSDGATLSGLWISGDRIWSVDTTNIRLMTYRDTLTSPVILTAPGNGSSVTGSLIDHTVRDVVLTWDSLEGATSYQWQCDLDTDLSDVPAGYEGITSARSVRLPALAPATTYYWRVRASAPVLSPWSEKQSFTTGLDAETVQITPVSPAAGSAGVPLKPVFQWTPVAEATAYELLVGTGDDFENPSIVKMGEYALPTNAWECDVSLEYDTTYYWKVRAINASTRSDWSTTGAFTTESPPDEAVPPAPSQPGETLTIQIQPETYTPLPTAASPPAIEPATSPTPLPTTNGLPAQDQSINMPGWLPYMVGGLLLIIILALIVILTMVLKIKHV